MIVLLLICEPVRRAAATRLLRARSGLDAPMEAPSSHRREEVRRLNETKRNARFLAIQALTFLTSAGGKRSSNPKETGGTMTKDHGPSVKDDKQYEGLRKKGMSKERAAKIANTPNASKKGGKNSGKKKSGSKS
jgi:hypothetical protein